MADTTISVGDIQLTGISDASTTYPSPLSSIFPGVSAEAWLPYRERFPQVFQDNNWRPNFGCFLIRAAGRIIVMDTGIGPEGSPLSQALGLPGTLLEKLHAVGVAPEDVDTVFLSHCHSDHVGWNTLEQAGERRPTFPRARYLLHRRDYDDFQRLQADGKLDFPHVELMVAPLERAGQLDLLTGEREIAPGIQALHTPGHTMGHMSLLLQSRGAGALLWGDVAHHPAQVTQPEISPSFDQDPILSAETRTAIMERIEAEGLIAGAGHFPEPGFGRVVRLEGKRYFKAL